MFVESSHLLTRFFSELVVKRFKSDVEIARYIAAVLADFAHVEKLYKIRNARGKRLEGVGEMLIESNPLLEAHSFDREREVRKQHRRLPTKPSMPPVSRTPLSKLKEFPMCIFGGFFVYPEIVLAGCDQPLMAQNLFDVPDGAAIE
jgi:hypothetical protein